MKQANDYEFNKDFMVYIVNNESEYDETNCFSYAHYLKNKEKYADKILIIAHKEVPVYFRKG